MIALLTPQAPHRLSRTLRRAGALGAVTAVLLASPAGPATASPLTDGEHHRGADSVGASWLASRAPLVLASTPVGAGAPAVSTKDGPAESVRERNDRLRRSASRRVGGLIVSGYAGLTPPADVLAAVRAGTLAGVILMGHNVRDDAQVRRATARIRRAARDGRQPPPIISVDQEGGTVRRLRTAAPSLSAAAMGARGPATARAQGRRTGADLRALGFTVNFAPVADVGSRSSFLGSRVFGASPSRVAANVCAFVDGMQATGVAATLKHFPGLGSAGRVSTDDAGVTINVSTATLRRQLLPYRQCAQDPRTLTMMSSAVYPRALGSRPAVLTPAAYRLLRGLGVHSPTITDALEAGAVRRAPQLATRAVNAGVTFLLTTNWSLAKQLRAELGSSVRGKRIPLTQIQARITDADAYRRLLTAP